MSEKEVVNPIVFGCNKLAQDFIEAFNVQGTLLAKRLTDKNELNLYRRLKVIPNEMHRFNTACLLTHKNPIKLEAPLGSNINQHLCNAYVYPSTKCRIRKLSVRATKFLLSLGTPDDSLRMDYREHLYVTSQSQDEERVYESIKGKFYEELLELPINGHIEYIYLISSTEMCLVLHRRNHKIGENEFFNIPIHPNFRTIPMKGASLEYKETYDNFETGNVFDVESLLVNLWIAETVTYSLLSSELP